MVNDISAYSTMSTEGLITNLKRRIRDFDDDQLNELLKVAKREYNRRHIYILIHTEFCDKDCYCIAIYRNGDLPKESKLFSLIEKQLAFDSGKESCYPYFDFTEQEVRDRIHTMEKYAHTQDCCEYWCNISDIDDIKEVKKRLAQHKRSHWRDKQEPEGIQFFDMLEILGIKDVAW